jgi:hypothetical protein
MRTINTYKPELESLLLRLQDRGCKIISGSNDGESHFLFSSTPFDNFLEELLGADEAWLRVVTPDSEGKKRTLYLVYGNEPGVIVCDHHCDDTLDWVVSEHGDYWEGRPQPTIEVE